MRLTAFAAGPTRGLVPAISGAALLLAAASAGAQDAGGQQGDGAAAPLVLDSIVVEGQSGVVTEGTGSYAAERATVGAKQPMELLDIPQTVTVITHQRIEDAQATTLEEAAYLIPNLSTATGDLFSGSLYTRGHEVFTYNLDGAPRPYLSLYGTAPDMFFFDRVELLSGPSGLFQGSGEPVGTINMVRKRPTDRFQGLGGASYGTFDSWRGEGDVGGPLTANGDLRGRVAAYGETQKTFVDITKSNRAGGYGTVEYDIGDWTTISAGGIYERQAVKRFAGLPSFTNGDLIDLPRKTFIGADWNDFKSDNTEVFGEVEHTLGFGGVLKASGRWYDRIVDLQSAFGQTGVDPTTGNFTMMGFAREFREKTGYFDGNLTTPFTLFGREVTATVGADYRLTSQIMRQNFDFSPGVQNIYTFDPYAIAEPTFTFPGTGPGFRLNTDTDTDELGAYLQAQAELTDRLKLTGGARYAQYTSKTEDTGRNIVTSDIKENRAIPYLGLGYDVTRNITVYTGYSEIFQPQTEQEANGAQLEPIVGRQVELGVKGAFLGDALFAQAAVYWLKDENRAEADPANPGAFLPSGQAVTRGFETAVSGSPYPGIDISVGYSFVDTELNTDPTPKHSFTAWGKYSFQEGGLKGLYVGLGGRAVSSFFNETGGVTITAPGYGVVDAMVGYDITPNFQIQANVKNLLDKTYVDRVNEVGRGNFYGEPLNAIVRLTGRF